MAGGGGDPGSGSPLSTGTRTLAFRRLWLAWAVTLFGDGVRGLALPIYVALTTRDPLAASAVVAAEVLPWLLIALPAGALVDRTSAKRVVLIAHTARAVLTALLVLAIATGYTGLALLCVFAFLITVGETFAFPASQSLLVQLAGRDELDRANAKFYAVHTIGLNLAGPLAAGLLVSVGAELAFGLTAAMSATGAVLVAGIPSRASHAPARRPGVGTRALLGEVAEGLRILWQVLGLRVLVTVIAFATLAAGALNAQTTLYAIEVLGLRTEVVPVLLVASAVATLAATRVVTPLSRRFSDGKVMVVSMALIGLGMIGFGFSTNLGTAIAGYSVIGVGLGGFNVLAAARRQRLTPPEAIGRLSGAYRMVAWGLAPVGAGLAGPVALLTSLGMVFVIFGAVLLIVLLLTTPLLLRTGRRPAAADEDAAPTQVTDRTAPPPTSTERGRQVSTTD